MTLTLDQLNIVGPSLVHHFGHLRGLNRRSELHRERQNKEQKGDNGNKSQNLTEKLKTLSRDVKD